MHKITDLASIAACCRFMLPWQRWMMRIIGKCDEKKRNVELAPLTDRPNLLPGHSPDRAPLSHLQVYHPQYLDRLSES